MIGCAAIYLAGAATIGAVATNFVATGAATIFAGAGATIAGWAMYLAAMTGCETNLAGATIAGCAMIFAGAAATILAVEWRVTTALNPLTASAVYE